MKLSFRAALVAVALLVTPSAIAQQQPAQPANFDIRVSSALRNDLAGLLIRMGQLAGCDVACHIVLSRVLVAVDAAAPVEPPKEAPAETPKP